MGGKYEGNVNFKVASICFDSRLILQNTDFMIEGLLSIEQSSPPEIGLDEKGLRKFSLLWRAFTRLTC